MSDSTVSPAMRSAASTARRIACSAASRSTTTPDLMPRERWWPMPSTSIAWVRPRSTSLVPRRGFSRAIMQQTLLEPMSSTETMPARRDRRAFRPRWN